MTLRWDLTIHMEKNRLWNCRAVCGPVVCVCVIVCILRCMYNYVCVCLCVFVLALEIGREKGGVIVGLVLTNSSLA